MPRLIEAGDRTWLAPEQIKFVQWRALANPYRDHATGRDMLASVTVETYHAQYRISCATWAEAEALAKHLVAEKSRIDLEDVAIEANKVAGLSVLKTRGGKP